MMSRTDVHGTVADGFERVREEFAAVVADDRPAHRQPPRGRGLGGEHHRRGLLADAPCFTDAERVALELVESVLTPNPSGERVSDELYGRASGLYDDRALATLIMAIGQVCFFLPLALIGRPLPGVPPTERWRP